MKPFDPKCLPAWAKWIAQDYDGTWWWYVDQPTKGASTWLSYGSCSSIPEAYAPPAVENWRDTLTEVKR